MQPQQAITDEQLAQLTPEQAEILLAQMPEQEDLNDMDLMFLRLDLEAIEQGFRLKVGHGPYEVRYLALPCGVWDHEAHRWSVPDI